MIPKTELLELYSKLVLVRIAEERISEEYYRDEMKTPVHLGIGGEAISVGVLHKMPKGSKVFGTYRNHALYLALSNDTDSFFGELFGRVSGGAAGKAGSMHLSIPEKGFLMTSAVVATTIPVAVGAALAQQYQGNPEPVVVFFGDGAVEEGAFWESLNFACLKKLNILFVCEDNDLAIHTFKRDRRGFESFEKVVSGFDCTFRDGDGSALENVMEATETVLNQMSKKGGPGFLHLDYFRITQHVGPGFDFDSGYREKPKDINGSLDPVFNFEKYLLANGVTEPEIMAIKQKMRAQVDQSMEKARGQDFPALSELYTDVYVNGDAHA